MALVVANNLQAAFGCAAQLVGADDQTSREVGLVSFSGPREGNGPLAAIVDSMECSESPLVAFAPNDTPFFTENDFAALRSKMDGVNTDVVVAVDDSNVILEARIDDLINPIGESFSQKKSKINKPTKFIYFES